MRNEPTLAWPDDFPLPQRRAFTDNPGNSIVTFEPAIGPTRTTRNTMNAASKIECQLIMRGSLLKDRVYGFVVMNQGMRFWMTEPVRRENLILVKIMSWQPFKEASAGIWTTTLTLEIAPHVTRIVN